MVGIFVAKEKMNGEQGDASDGKDFFCEENEILQSFVGFLAKMPVFFKVS